MSSHCNPSVVDDGLVFLYDVEDIQSYKGEPTENIFLNPTFIGTAGTQTSTVTDNWYFSGYTGDSGFKFYNNSTSPFPLKFSNEGSVITTGANDDSTTQNRRFYCNEVLQAGATYTVSAWIYTTRTSGISIAHFEYGGSSLNSGYFSGTSTHPNHVLGQWYYWEDTYTVGADYTSGLIGPVHSGSSDTIVGIQRFQIEKKSHATPFVDGTRSATQGLLDRTGTSTINISNASFDSNAQMTFDGTDDYISIPTYTFGNGSWTLNMWVNVSAFANYNLMSNSSGGPVSNVFGAHGGNPKIFYMNYDGAWKDHYGNLTLTTNNWYFLTWVNYEGASASAGTMKMYVNGVADSDVFNSYTTNGGPCNVIGKRWSGTSFNGKISQVSINTKSLSGAEVLQNFNATKSRFSL